jgi:tetratricopeptide (TPR) repeat protein
MQLKDFKKGKYYTDKAREAAADWSNIPPGLQASIESSYADYYAHQKQYQEAIAYNEKALVTFQSLEDTEFIIDISSGLSLNYALINQKVKAYSYIKNTLEHMKEFYSAKVHRNAYKKFTEVYLHFGDYKNAFESQLKLSDYQDSMQVEKNLKAVNELAISYETGKKDLEIKTLNLLNLAERKSKNQVIVFTVISGILFVLITLLFVRWLKLKNRQKLILSEQKNLLIKMNPHFIANSMVSIKNYMDTNPAKAGDFLSKYNTLMRDVLDLTSNDSIALSNELSMLENYIQLEQLRVEFEYRIKIAENIDALFVKVPPLLLQPVVENAIRHGFENSADKNLFLDITIHKSAGNISYTVSDNGVGIKNPVHKMNEKVLKHNSVSIQILNSRLKHLTKDHSESITIQHLNPGTAVTLSFPVINN